MAIDVSSACGQAYRGAPADGLEPVEGAQALAATLWQTASDELAKQGMGGAWSCMSTVIAERTSALGNYPIAFSRGDLNAIGQLVGQLGKGPHQPIDKPEPIGLAGQEHGSTSRSLAVAFHNMLIDIRSGDGAIDLLERAYHAYQDWPKDFLPDARDRFGADIRQAVFSAYGGPSTATHEVHAAGAAESQAARLNEIYRCLGHYAVVLGEGAKPTHELLYDILANYVLHWHAQRVGVFDLARGAIDEKDVSNALRLERAEPLLRAFCSADEIGNLDHKGVIKRFLDSADKAQYYVLTQHGQALGKQDVELLTLANSQLVKVLAAVTERQPEKAGLAEAGSNPFA